VLPAELEARAVSLRDSYSIVLNREELEKRLGFKIRRLRLFR